MCSGALVCADSPSSTVSFTGGETSFFRFACPWGTGVVITGAVTGTIPCDPGVGEMIVLGVALGMI